MLEHTIRYRMPERHERRSGGGTGRDLDVRSFEMGLPLMWLNGPRASRVECLLDDERNDAVKSFGVIQAGPGG